MLRFLECFFRSADLVKTRLHEINLEATIIKYVAHIWAKYESDRRPTLGYAPSLALNDINELQSNSSSINPYQ